MLNRHDDRELERVFSAGLSSTTPSVREIDVSGPRPWVYSRVLAFLGLAFGALWLGLSRFDTPILLPGTILLGTFAVPIAVAVFFFECNVARNISLFTVSKLFVWGGVLGALISLVGYEMTPKIGEIVGPPIAGVVEEVAKILAVLILASAVRFRWTINGLALGAAVGAGFAAFESAGYALYAASQSKDMLFDNLIQRGLLAPFAHVVWTAVTVAALWRVRAGRPLELSMFLDRRCLVMILVVMALHATWNTPLPDKAPFALGYLALGSVGWLMAIGLMRSGLREIRRAQGDA